MNLMQALQKTMDANSVQPTPVVSTPVVSTPVVSTPVVSTPVVSTPVVSTPVVSTPVVSTPVVSTPVVSTPVVQDKGLAKWIGGNAPSFQAHTQYLHTMGCKLAGNHMQEVSMLALAALVSRQNLLLAGLHGEAKTSFAETFASKFDNASFKRAQFTPTTPPEVVVGGVPLRKINEGVIEHSLSDGIVSGHIVLLDELDKASNRTQNLLLEYLNTRSVINAGRKVQCPTEFVIATRNDEFDAAYFADRFAAVYHFDRSKPSSFMSDYAKMLDKQDDFGHMRFTPAQIGMLRAECEVLFKSTMETIASATIDAKDTLPEMWLLDFLDKKNDAYLSKFGGVSPRKVLAAIKLVCAWAVCHGRSEIEWCDLYAAQFVFDIRVIAEQVKSEIMSSLIMVNVRTNDDGTTCVDPYPLASGKEQAESMLRKATRDRLMKR